MKKKFTKKKGKLKKKKQRPITSNTSKLECTEPPIFLKIYVFSIWLFSFYLFIKALFEPLSIDYVLYTGKMNLAYENIAQYIWVYTCESLTFLTNLEPYVYKKISKFLILQAFFISLIPQLGRQTLNSIESKIENSILKLRILITNYLIRFLTFLTLSFIAFCFSLLTVQDGRESLLELLHREGYDPYPIMRIFFFLGSVLFLLSVTAYLLNLKKIKKFKSIMRNWWGTQGVLAFILPLSVPVIAVGLALCALIYILFLPIKLSTYVRDKWNLRYFHWILGAILFVSGWLIDF